MFTDYEKAELTLEEYQNNPAKHYRRLVNYYNWTIYEMIDREEMSNTFWYMAVNHKSKEVSIHSEGYDISELPDIIDMLDDFDYYFK